MGKYGLTKFMPATCPYFHFQSITWVNTNGFHLSWYVYWDCRILVWIANEPVLSVFDSYLPAMHQYVYLSKYQWIFTKHSMCIDILKIWFGIANGQSISTFDRVICPPHDNGRVLSFHVFLMFEMLDVYHIGTFQFSDIVQDKCNYRQENYLSNREPIINGEQHVVGWLLVNIIKILHRSR